MVSSSSSRGSLSLPQALRRAGSHFVPAFFPVLISCTIFPRFARLSRAPAAEDLASRMLTAFPPGRISAQDALLHGFFSPLPPQLYQVPPGKLSLDFTSPTNTYFKWPFTTRFFSTLDLDISFLPALPPHSCMRQSLHPSANSTACFSIFFHSTTKLITEVDLDGMCPCCTFKAEVCAL